MAGITMQDWNKAIKVCARMGHKIAPRDRYIIYGTEVCIFCVLDQIKILGMAEFKEIDDAKSDTGIPPAGRTE